jgi:uncharacterized protein (DUF427 family)
MLAHVPPRHRTEPGPDQESVWDYPRPPRLERTDRLLVVEHAGTRIAESRAGWRVLETSQPPAFYLPPGDVATDLLEPSGRRSWCEWKGQATYWTARVGDEVAEDAAWSYPSPTPGFEAIAGHLAFYPQKVDACFVDGERVDPNPGSFYGGWITSAVVGPFKGAPGTEHW